MTVGIIGLGNAGQRHARNALALGHDVVAYDPQPVEVPGIARVSSMEQLRQLRPAHVVVASPPIQHFLDAVYCVCDGLNVLVEKPLCVTYEEADTLRLRANANRVQVWTAYQMRCLPSLRRFVDEVKEERSINVMRPIVGVIANVDRMSDWPPASYRRDLLLEFSHELDIAAWLFEPPYQVMTYELDAMHWVGFLRAGRKETSVCICLSAAGERQRRGIELWDDSRDWKWEFDRAENEAAYKTELELFLKGEPLSDGLGALRLIEAARRSAESGRWEEA